MDIYRCLGRSGTEFYGLLLFTSNKNAATITDHVQNYDTTKKRDRTWSPTRQQEHNRYKPIGSLILGKTIAPLERTVKTTTHNNTQNLHTIEAVTNNKTNALDWTAAEATERGLVQSRKEN